MTAAIGKPLLLASIGMPAKSQEWLISSHLHLTDIMADG